MAYNGKLKEAGSADNLLKVYDLATDHQVEEGLTWYSRANAWAGRIASEYNLPLHVVVGMTAALSPNNRWGRNQRDTIYVIEQVRAGNTNPWSMNCATFKQNVWSAIDIMNSNGLDSLTGPKVEQFYQDIMYPDEIDRTRVTVDIWAYRAWIFDSSAKVPTIYGNLYEHISEHYMWASEEVKLMPNDFQAIVWIVVRNAGKERKYNRLELLERQFSLW